MNNELISKLIPAVLLLVLRILESLGGLYLQDKRTKNDYDPSIGYKEFDR